MHVIASCVNQVNHLLVHLEMLWEAMFYNRCILENLFFFSLQGFFFTPMTTS